MQSYKLSTREREREREIEKNQNIRIVLAYMVLHDKQHCNEEEYDDALFVGHCSLSETEEVIS